MRWTSATPVKLTVMVLAEKSGSHYHASASRDRGIAAHNVVVEGNDQRVISTAAAALHTRLAAQR